MRTLRGVRVTGEGRCRVTHDTAARAAGAGDLPPLPPVLPAVARAARPEPRAASMRHRAVWTMADHTSRAGTTTSEIVLPKLSEIETARVNSVC